jgi:hypothetical protein
MWIAGAGVTLLNNLLSCTLTNMIWYHRFSKLQARISSRWSVGIPSSMPAAPKFTHRLNICLYPFRRKRRKNYVIVIPLFPWKLHMAEKLLQYPFFYDENPRVKENTCPVRLSKLWRCGATIARPS